MAGGECGSQVGPVAAGGDVDPADAEQGDAVAVLGARVGAVVAMDGAGAAHPDAAPGPPPGQALGRAWAAAAHAVHAVAQFAVDRGGAAGAAAAGPGPPRVKPAGRLRGGEGGVGVAAGFCGGGRRGKQGRRFGGAAGQREVCGIAVFLAIYLTYMMGMPNRSDKESHSAATARSAPRLQRRGSNIGADGDVVPYLAACATPRRGCDAEGAAALVKQERVVGHSGEGRPDALPPGPRRGRPGLRIAMNSAGDSGVMSATHSNRSRPAIPMEVGRGGVSPWVA
jgi:hypothetical protein